MFAIALAGFLVAGVYGAIHDQISYAISPEYFTKLKFRQFHWADVGLPPRAFASEVGFIASAGVGLFAGWFLARVGLDQVPAVDRRRIAARAFGIMLASAAIAGALGACAGCFASRGDLGGWRSMQTELELRDLPSFVMVAWIHAGGYVGAAIGLIAAIWHVRRMRMRAERG
jgi:hypothetical protein